jgi:hypothetical protein
MKIEKKKALHKARPKQLSLAARAKKKAQSYDKDLMFTKSYEHARKDAAKESGMNINKFPIKCPRSLEELFPES